MDFRLIWTEAAKGDLKSIVTYIAVDDATAALSFGERILTSVDQLESFPRSGRVVPEKREEQLREILFSPYRIVYQIDDVARTVNIVRIWHSAKGDLSLV